MGIEANEKVTPFRPMYEEDKWVQNAFGFVPTSVWNIPPKDDARLKAFISDSGDPRGLVRHRYSEHSPLQIRYSEFSSGLAERVLIYWSEVGHKVVDPFSGRTTRAAVARLLGRDYEGYEIGPLTHAQTIENMANLDREHPLDLWSTPLGGYTLHLGDGCEMAQTPDESAALAFTCPPYWNIEKYEEIPGQLSSLGSYNSFIDLIGKALKNCYRVLKPGGFCVWVVADFRREGVFYPFHCDVIERMSDAGLKLHDVIISVLKGPYALFPEYAAEHRYTVKQHEFIIVGRKPGDQICTPRPNSENKQTLL